MFEDPTPTEYDPGETAFLNALFLTGGTVGRMQQGQRTLYVRDASDLNVTVGAAIIVVAAGAVGGDLVTTVASAAGQVITLTDPALSPVALAPVGNPAAPSTVTCTVALPDGTEVTPAVTNQSPGHYRATYTTSLEGEHFYKFVGTGTATADRWRKFTVRPERVP